MRVFVPGDGGARELFALAAAERVQVRHLRPSVPTLEDVFAHAVGEKSEPRHADSRSGLSPLRRARAPRGRALVGDRPRRHPHAARQARVPRPAARRRGSRSSSAPCRSTPRRTCRRPAFLAPTPETFRQFLEQQEIFVFFVTVYVGAGLIANDRRANALQIYLSKPLTRAEYIFGKLGDPDDVPAARHLGAGDRCC